MSAYREGLVRDQRPWDERHQSAALWLVCFVVATMLCWLAYSCAGCTRTDQQRTLTVLTEAANATLPALSARIESEEGACLEFDTYAEAKACVDESRAHWAPALAAIDVLLAVDRAALDGRVDLSTALAAYCDLALLWPSLPAPPVAGGCVQ